MTVDDFAAFMTARYDEAEALARATDPAPWRSTSPSLYVDSPGIGIIVQVRHFEDAAFIASVDPAHRLADIALKRAILALHHPELVEVINADQDERSGDFCAECSLEPYPCATGRQLGTEFAGHPGYRPEWAP